MGRRPDRPLRQGGRRAAVRRAGHAVRRAPSPRPDRAPPRRECRQHPGQVDPVHRSSRWPGGGSADPRLVTRRTSTNRHRKHAGGAQAGAGQARLLSGQHSPPATDPQGRADHPRATAGGASGRHGDCPDPPDGRRSGQPARRAGGADDAPPPRGDLPHQGRPRARRPQRERRLRSRSQGAVFPRRPRPAARADDQARRDHPFRQRRRQRGRPRVDGRRRDRPPRRGDLHDRRLGRGRRQCRQDQLHFTDRARLDGPQGRREDPRRDPRRDRWTSWW